MKILFIAALILTIVAARINAEEKAEYSFGGFAFYSNNKFAAEINLSDRRFTGSNASGFALGAYIDYKLPASASMGLRAGYANLNAGIYSANANVDAYLSEISFEPYLAFNPLDKLTVYGCIHFGFLIRADYESDADFEPIGKRGSGSLSSVRESLTGIIAGASYDFYLSEDSDFAVSPGVEFLFNSSDLLDKESADAEFETDKIWKISAFRAGFAIKFNRKRAKEEIRVKYSKVLSVDTVKIQTRIDSTPYVKLGIAIIDSSDNLFENKIYRKIELSRTDTLFASEPAAPRNFQISTNAERVSIVKHYASESAPLTPYVFFDSASVVLPSAYKKSLNSIIDGRGAKYLSENLLNIVAKRMKEFPGSKLEVRGFADPESESGDCELAKARAESVKSHIVDNLGIVSGRIEIIAADSDCSPKNTSQTKNERARAENRRVELSSSNARLLAPVRTENFLETRSATPNRFEILINPEDIIDINKLTIVFKGNGEDSKIFEYAKNEIKSKYSFNTENLFDSFSAGEAQTDVYVEREDGSTAMDRASLMLEKTTTDVKVERISLILFELGSANIDPRQRNILSEFANKIETDAEVRVSGYTDDLGDSLENKKLARERASAAAEILKKIKPELNIIIEAPAFEEFPPGLRSYETPAERFYARTVKIEVYK